MKFLRTIRGRLSILLGAFFLLVIVSVGVMFWSLRSQEDDALVINLAGRQRMLTQRMTWLAIAQPDSPELDASVQLFEQTQQALSFGGTTLDAAGNFVQLPPPPDSDLSMQLAAVAQTWEQFKAYLHPPDEAQLSVWASVILNQLDDVVSAYEDRAVQKQQRLVSIQIFFLIAALLLLAWGFVTTRSKIVNPLMQLGQVVSQVGKGDLEKPIPPMQEDELGELAQTFEIMRVELTAAQRLLEDKVDQRTRELSSAFEFSQEIVAQRDLETLMISVIERARILMDAQSAALCILTADGRELEMMASNGDNTPLPGLRQSVQRGIALPVIAEGQTVIENTVCADCSFLASRKPGGCAATPLRVDEQTIGALCVVRSKNGNGYEIPRFDEDGQRALSLLANSAAIAITNARLTKAERHSAREAAALTEREKLAADLHDNLAQTLSFTGLQLEQLEESLGECTDPAALKTLKQVENANQNAYQQVRAALTGLMQPAPSCADFERKLRECLADFEHKSGLPVEVNQLEMEALCLPSSIQTQILHILGEALANIRQHAGAKNVSFRVLVRSHQAIFTLNDDGRGFDLNQPPKADHFGLQIMRTRADRSGGELKVVSAPEEGTSITITYPLNELQTGGRP